MFLNNIKKYYNEKLVLVIEMLEIEKGKITGIIGPNGSGKSTLLNIIGGLDEDYLGTIAYDPKVTNQKPYDTMTLVSQKPYLFKRKVYENIEYPLKIRNINKADMKKKVNRIISRLELEDLKEKKAHLLSGGESQKVSLARALVFEPELLLLDEPTSNIDPESIKILEREIVRFNKETGATIIIVTHNLEQSNRICDRIIYLENGRVSS
ncbi:ATP-binding cassette domain-containing protein [Proteiniborus sp. MB09-C3]|uniref:ABC transporter ATP-binding protein n=1 Tax=Proteiniborus sp. MB09-C3 TaxID=3050072 RepID=UPI00255332D2|nr:ATP-binding cassette domain-containing protein [Proteiniborus sp. MB09-C3]WIV13885.1 ATP-binding cassette domain-containing protein [Proteiniborus sp. MB09-C3]